MPRYLDPKSDIVFKHVFGQHPHLLKSFLNAVLPLAPDRQIVELSYLPTEQIPLVPTLKRTIADVKCTDKLGRTFIVEMQVQWEEGFKERLLFQSGQAFVRQLEKGEDYQYLQPVYGLGLIGSNFDPANTDWYHHYQVVKASNPKEIIEHLQLVFIELPKFPIRSHDEKKLRLLWLRFLREINEKTKLVDPELLNVPEISEAVRLTELSAYSEGELRAYDEYWDQVSREKTLIQGSYKRGKAEGKAEGEQIGIMKGEQIGIMKGKIEIAKQLSISGMSLTQICEITGLTLPRLEEELVNA